MEIRLDFDKSSGCQIVNILCLSHPTRAGELEHLIKDETGVTVKVSKRKKDRSRSQENYYRKWSREFGKFCGLAPDEIHDELLCMTFGSEEFVTKFGTTRRRPHQRSSDCTTSTYADLIDTLIRISAEMGFRVPPPYEQDNY